MQVAQRGTDVAWASNGYLALDRFNTANNSTAGRFSMKQTADGPSGFANCLELDVTTADTSIAAAEHMVLQYKLEGQDLQQLKKGTSDAESFTISFYVKGNGNATYMCEVIDRDNTRLIHQQFAVTSSWNRIELTFVGDTTGALNDDNAHSLDIQFWLHAGSTFTSGTYIANTWAGQVNANRAVGISSIYSSTDNYIRITGLQMEVSPVATPFEHRSVGQELALCQRYYQTINPKVNSIFAAGYQNNAERISQTHRLGIEMRTEPTCTVHGTWNVTGCDQPVFTSFSKNIVSTHILKSGGAGSAFYYPDGTGDYFSMDAEL